MGEKVGFIAADNSQHLGIKEFTGKCMKSYTQSFIRRFPYILVRMSGKLKKNLHNFDKMFETDYCLLMFGDYVDENFNTADLTVDKFPMKECKGGAPGGVKAPGINFVCKKKIGNFILNKYCMCFILCVFVSVDGFGQFKLFDSLSLNHKITANFRDKSLEEMLLADPVYLVKLILYLMV